MHCPTLLPVLVSTFCLALSAAGEPLAVALLQLRPEGTDLEANAAKAVEACRRAAAKGADIALLPELWSTGYREFTLEDPGEKAYFYSLARATDSDYVQQFARLADELDMAIAFTYLQAFDPLPRNVLTLFDRHGKEVLTYAKVHTCDFKPMERSLTPGEDFFVAPLDTAKGTVQVGAMICFDREQPESARILMLKGAELVLTPNACNLDMPRIDQFKVRAWENVMGVAMTNYPAPQYNGCSVAYSAKCQELVRADDKPGIYLAAFDLEELRERRGRVIQGNAYRRPHRYGLLTSPQREPVWKRTDGLGEPYDPGAR